MNMKTVFGILGVAIVIGSVGYIAKRSMSAQKTDNNANHAFAPDKSIKAQNVSETMFNLNIDKQDLAQKISERHEEAKKEMQVSVKAILNDSQPEITKNDEAKKKLSEALDTL